MLTGKEQERKIQVIIPLQYNIVYLFIFDFGKYLLVHFYNSGHLKWPLKS